jgi:hypothetical protein
MNRFMLMALVAILSLVEVAAGQGIGSAAENPGQRDWGSSRGGFSRQFEDPAAGEKALQELQKRFATLDKQVQQPLPERELTVKMNPALKIPFLRRPDPKLLENKFVGIIKFTPAVYSRAGQDAPSEFRSFAESRRMGGIWSTPPTEEQIKLHSATWQLGEPMRIYDMRIDARRMQPMLWSTYFQGLKELTPAKQLPEPAVLDFLTSEAADRDVESGGFSEFTFDQDRRIDLTFAVYAPTAEEATDRTRGIARLLDGGMSRPVQTYMLGRGKQSLADAEARLAEVLNTSEAIAAEEKILATPSEISPEILTQLKSQKVMIAVEEAGLAARVKACDAMLADNRKLEISTLQSIGDMKVKAEIERVGLKEKLDQINKFIGEGDERTRRQEQIQTLASKLRRENAEFGSAMTRATHFANLVDLFAPLQVRENEIAVSPIEWTAPSQE